MDFQAVREQMAAFLRQQGVDAVCAYPEERRRQRSGPVAAVSLRACQGGPGGFRDYLGERYDESNGRWQELYGRRATLTFGLDLYGESRESWSSKTTSICKGEITTWLLCLKRV